MPVYLGIMDDMGTNWKTQSLSSSLKPFYSRSRTGAPSFHISFISSITALTS